MHILAIQPYDGGSHQSFLASITRRSRHRWTVISGSPRHWKWRMRNAPLSLAQNTATHLRCAGNDPVDLVFCNDMLDLPQWRGFGVSLDGEEVDRRDTKACRPWWRAPAVVYFHENQLTYPIASRARVDFHYGYTNLLTALAAQAVWFNSRYHRDTFIEAAKTLVGRMPDQNASHDFERLVNKSHVIPPGFDPVTVPRTLVNRTSPAIRIGWVARWEEDKRPDVFAQLLDELAETDLAFELILLGQRGTASSDQSFREGPLAEIVQKHSQRILVNEYASTRETYCKHLAEMDVVVSTAEHEFFGIAVLEAISAGAIPVVPDRLAYPEWVPDSCRYRSLSEACDQIRTIASCSDRQRLIQECQAKISSADINQLIHVMDHQLEKVARNRGATLN